MGASTPPTLHGTSPARVVVRPGTEADVAAVDAIRAERAVVRWWSAPEPDGLRAALLGEEEDAVTLVIEVAGTVSGAIQYWEETEPEFRHAGIDIFLAEHVHGRGIGREAIGLVVDHLIDWLGHHRLTIDPAAANEVAIRCYAAVGFRPVGTLRQYQRMDDGKWHDGLLMELLASER